MNKQQFMGELKQLLGDIPAVERDEALNYYEDYFADAGEENEAEIIAKLQSPEQVAYTIKAGLADPDSIEGEFTESGFRAYEKYDKDELANTIPNTEKRGFGFNGQNGRNNLILAIIILVLLCPILLPALGSVFGVIFGLAAAVFGVVFALAIAGIAIIVAGAVVLVVGILNISSYLLASVTLIGVALMLLGFGSIIFTAGTKIIAKLLPAIVRIVTTFCKKIVNAINRKRGYV